MGQRQKIPIFFSFGLASAHRARAKYRLAVCLRKYSNGIETKPVMFAHLPAVEGVGGGAGKCAFFFLGGSGITISSFSLATINQIFIFAIWLIGLFYQLVL